MNLTVVLGVLRPRMPQRRMEQSPDELLEDERGPRASIIIWAMTEGRGCSRGWAYLLTGGSSRLPLARCRLGG